ncbi:MAG: bestrophin family protein [Flavobacteriales bacterium]|jgi:putative membrane protein
MIKYNPKSWLTFIFSFHKSDTVRILWKELIYIAILTAIITALELHFYPTSSVLKNLTSVYSLLGFVISLLLVFRTNTAYDRWWEGRKLWGSVVNDSRNLSSLLSSFDLNTSERTYYTELIIAFSKSMKEHLRRNKLDLPFPLDESSSADNQPLWIAHELRKALHELRATNRIDSIEWQQLSRHLDQLIDSLGACERILNTPIPFSYSLFFKKFIFIYVVTMPLAFVELFEYWSVLISTFVFYALVSMEILAEEIEDPFGTDDNDLPLDDICDRIEDGTRQVLTRS